MKTTGLTFLEAVKALKDKKCERIECDSAGTQYGKGDYSESIMFMRGNDFIGGIGLTTDDFLGTWSLIVVKQKISGTIKWGRDNNGHVRPVEFIHDSGELKGSHVDTYCFPQKPTMKATLEWTE